MAPSTRSRKAPGPKETAARNLRSVASPPAKKTTSTKKVAEKSGFRNRAAAEAFTARIVKSAGGTMQLIVDAFNKKIWLAYELKSWEAYRNEVLGQYAVLALPTAARQAAVKELVEQGVDISSRALGEITGTSQMTAQRDLAEARQQVNQNDSPDLEPEVDDDGIPVLDEDGNPVFSVPEPEPAMVQGRDGKQYPASPTPPPTPATPEIVKLAKSLARKADALDTALGDLYLDPAYAANQEKVDEILDEALAVLYDTLGQHVGEPVSV